MLRHTLIAALVLLAGLFTAACENEAEESAWEWELPRGFPEPSVPEDNPMTEEKVELGRHLFYDTRMSGNQTTSCSSCHLQHLAFTDGLGRAEGSTGEFHPRSSMSLANVAYNPRFNWANHLVDTLEFQALTPMFGDTPVELGMGGREDELLQRLASEPMYVEMFDEAFPDDPDPISVGNITKALASFQRTLISGNAPYDEWVRGDAEAISESAVRGMELFFSERLECFHCHGGFNFSDSLTHSGLPLDEVAFHNTGLYNLDDDGSYPSENTGLYEVTGEISDMGRFRAPTLRNVAVTAPYMHDGSIGTLDEVIDHYAAGGRTIEEGPFAGDGSENIWKSEFLPGFIITEQERADLIAFLESLTDESFLSDERFSDPFE